ncbi:MAG: efflux RND transporter periplasmic adaptor subunit, partial [Isosphaeraceae bacterium]|nr:efflux RND transporter periplasmic adaptor subunit [Isosphaeraceae bacterium]
VEVARAALGVAEADLDATYIRAPEDGWIVRRFIDAGGSVRLGYPILAMRLGRRAWVEAWVHESQVAQIRIGSPAEVAFGALPGRIFHGRVEAIGALAHTELQGAIVPPTLGQLIRPPTMVDIRIALVENNERLVPGLTALVGISRNSAGVASSEGGPHAKAGTREALPSGVDEIRGFSGAQRSPPATATAEDGPPLTEAGKAGG